MPRILIDDNNWQQHAPINGRFEFNGPRIMNAVPPRLAAGSDEMIPGWSDEDFTLIPRAEWDDRIAQKDKEQSWLEDIVRGTIPCTDQNGLGYCHAYGTIAIAECQRLIQNHPFVPLSAESVGGPITGWRNRGADPTDDIKQMAQYGACPKSFMDREHSLSPGKWKEGWQADALKYRVHEWRDMRTTRKMFDAAATMALLGIPGGLGYMWWSHYISGPYRLLKSGNKYALRNRNNWGADYGDDGFLDMVEGRGTPDWLFAGFLMTPTD